MDENLEKLLDSLHESEICDSKEMKDFLENPDYQKRGKQVLEDLILTKYPIITCQEFKCYLADKDLNREDINILLDNSHEKVSDLPFNIKVRLFQLIGNNINLKTEVLVEAFGFKENDIICVLSEKSSPAHRLLKCLEQTNPQLPLKVLFDKLNELKMNDVAVNLTDVAIRIVKDC